MITVIVTGVGAIIGYGVVRSLRLSKFSVRIVGLDIYPDAVGRHWCDEFLQAPLTSSENYVDFLRDVVEKYSVDLVIPGIEQDAYRFAVDDCLRSQCNTQFAVNNPLLVKTSYDKWTMHLALQKAGFKTIKTAIDGEFPDLVNTLGLPMVLKPRISYASKGLHVVDNDVDFFYFKKKMGAAFMAQEFVGDENSEYTLGAFGLGNGTSAGKITFLRKLSLEGSTSKAQVVCEPALEELVDKMVDVFKPVGPTNFQFRRQCNAFLLLEINPRISSSTSLRTAFGYNEAEMCIDYFLLKNEVTEPFIKKGSAERFIEDYVTYDCRHI